MPSQLTEAQRKDEKATAESLKDRQERLAERSVWNVQLWGVADTAEDAQHTVEAIVEAGKKGGMRSGFVNAENVPNVTVSAAGIPHARTYVDPTSEEAVKGVPFVKNTPLNDDGLPDPEREVEKSPKLSGDASK